MPSSTYKTPSSILIVGSGVFGLSTAWTLTQRPEYAKTRITVVDDAAAVAAAGSGSGSDEFPFPFPPLDSASVDSSRIIRADYADPHYAELAVAAQAEWRKHGDDDLGGQGRYSESGLLLLAAADDDDDNDDNDDDEPASCSSATAKKLTAMEYTKASWRNVQRIAQRVALTPESPESMIRTLDNADALRSYLGTRGSPGDWGYINMMSGWADAAEGMRWQYRRVKATGRVEFVDARVTELVTEGDRVVGARLAGNDDDDDDDDDGGGGESGGVLTAELVVVAAGAWTGALIDLRGRCEATGHALGYVGITPDEQDALGRRPVVLNLTSGLFVIPPRDRMLKVARHSFGYLNPVTVRRALPTSSTEPRAPIVVSLPMTSRNDGDDGGLGSGRLPAEAAADLRRAFRNLVPPLLSGGDGVVELEHRPWAATRLCWYSDTRDGDWLVDYHPGWRGLFVATGDSGHGYKFLPVLGDRIVDCLEGRGGELGAKWRWKELAEGDRLGRETDGRFQGLVTEDGSRSGRPGMILAQELAREATVMAAEVGRKSQEQDEEEGER